MAESATNIGAFVRAVKTEIELEGFKRFRLFKNSIAKQALERVVDRTPVDTGRLKANWVVGINSIPSDVDVDKFDKGGEVSKAEGRVVIDSSSGLFDDINIVNNIEYLQYIHDGTDRITANPFVLGVAEELGLELIVL